MEFIVIENGIDKNWNGESEYNVETKAGDKVTIELDNCSIATGKVTKVEDGKIYYRKSNGDVMSIPQDMPTLNILRHGIELAV